MDLEAFLKKKYGKKYKKVLRELLDAHISKKIKYKSFLDLLKLHKSSRERLMFYDKFYREVEEFIEDVIIDLGCGFHPFSIKFSRKFPRIYYAIDYCDIIVEILEREKNFFEEMGIKIVPIKEDVIFNLDKLKDLINSEEEKTLFLLKNILIFGRINKRFYKNLENFCKEKNIKFLIASNSKFSLSGKRKIDRKEKVEKILESFGSIVKEFEIPNERFYVVSIEF